MFAFEEIEFACARGDVLMLYTDGVIEASNRQVQQFEEEHLRRLLAAKNRAAAQDLSATVIQAVKDFSAAKTLPDDATVVCVRLT